MLIENGKGREIYNFLKDLGRDHSSIQISEDEMLLLVQFDQQIELLIFMDKPLFFHKRISVWYREEGGIIRSANLEKLLEIIENFEVKREFLFNLDLFEGIIWKK